MGESASKDVPSVKADTASEDSETPEECSAQVACQYISRGFKIFITFLFSHVGLTCLVVTYTLFGGIVFKELELPQEKEIRRVATVTKNASVDNIIDFVDSMDKDVLFQKTVWNSNVRRILREYELEIHRLTKENNWDGSFGDEGYQWTFANSLLYSVTVITTIGYGNITPKTGWGRFVTIVYACFGIPMTMLCLRNIGNLMAGCFQLIYRFACVNMTYQYIKLQRRRMKQRFFSKVQKKTKDIKKWAKRKQSIVSTMIHTAIENHTKSMSQDNIDSVSLAPIEEDNEVDYDVGRNDFDAIKPLDASGSSIEADHLKSSDSATEQPERRNTIGAINKIYVLESQRKHSLCSSKKHKAHIRDLKHLSKSQKRLASSIGSRILPADEDDGDFNTNLEERSRSGSETATASSMLSLTDFKADDMILKSRLKTTRSLVPIPVCLLIMTGYIILGAMIFTPWEENWDFLIGFYFCFTTLTTIGFGDFVPGMASSWDSDEKRVFCVVYLLFGMALLAMSFHLIQEEVKHKCKKIAIKIGLVEEKITQFLDSYDK